ncbi:hypothetical protein [Streptomyces lonarensis]|uniref:Uncharacterized protein n=1 Tax=Streptomyces lonarensis TaxID=700599 RepID=A0A7X6I0V0_9ACTN|nr:hypothetical protein [Streptomyces lonarensis]NJQ07634.1 hypothetical protein [Streptomyces lonarensis]
MTGFEIVAVILASGFVAGGAWDRIKKIKDERRDARERELRGPDPVCGCTHHLAYHDPREGRCYAMVKTKQPKQPKKSKQAKQSASPEPAAADAGGKPAAEPRQCPCRRYAGPEPLATLYAPEITGGAGNALPRADD